MKFTTFDKDVAHVAKLPDTPTLENGYTPAALKMTFDRAGEEVKEYLNNVLLPELEAVSGGAGAERIGSAPIGSLEGDSVQAKLESVARLIAELANGTIPDATVTPEKFVPEIAAFMTEGSVKGAVFTTPGEHTFIPTRSGTYKVQVQGGGGGGCVAGTYSNSWGGGSGAWAMAWVRLEAGHAYRAVVGEGGDGLKASGDYKLISYAAEGGASAFYDGEEEILWADGGKTKMHTSGPALSRGGVLSSRGCYPSFTDMPWDDAYNMARGGDSHFGFGALARDGSAADIGTGGYGASFDIGAVRFYNGGKGGNGAVVIEWIE